MTDTLPEVHSHPHGGSAITGAFTKKIGPLPGYAWVLGVLVLAYGYHWYTTRNGAAITPTTDAGAALVSGDASGIGSTGDGTATVGFPNTGDGTVTPVQAPNPYTVLKPPPGTKYEVDYTHGGSTYEVWPDGSKHYINSEQYQFLGKPTRTIVIGTPPKTPSAPKPAPRTYTVQHGDTLRSIAQHFYNNPGRYLAIYNANTAVINKTNAKAKSTDPFQLHAGERLVIPT